MDREFMMQYVEAAHEDLEMDAVQQDEEYHALLARLQQLQQELIDFCGGTNSEFWQKHEAVAAQRNLLTNRAFRLVYLLGAEEREKMLR